MSKENKPSTTEGKKNFNNKNYDEIVTTFIKVLLLPLVPARDIIYKILL